MTPKLCSRCKERPAVIFITRIEGEKSTPEGLCLKCARELNIKPVTDLLDKMNFSDEDIEAASEEMAQMMGMLGGDDDDEDAEGFMPGGAATFNFMQEMMGEKSTDSDPSAEKTKTNKNSKGDKKNKKRKYLGLYCTDLTARAREGQLDRIIGRDRELYRVIQILCRRSKNNPCLIGEPGVGKTAIAEGLALKIADGNVPAKLMDKEIHLLDMTSLVAGTQFRGQFESRIKGLIDEVKAQGNIILFIDEVHSLVGTGDSEGSMNAANILKPALSRGEVQVIGATTFNEYRKHIEKDSALERRFQPVKVEEPSVEDTIAVLDGIREYYETFHGVTVSKPIITSAVQLSERYINDRFLPDKAIDLLDEACACAALRNKVADRLYVLEKEINALSAKLEELEQPPAENEQPDYEAIANTKFTLSQKEAEVQELKPQAAEGKVTADDLAHVIELWTGIPAAKVKESDLNRLANLESHIKEKIIGQDEAISLVSLAVRRSRVQISPRRRPASFIFAGPTGVGKTELVKVLAAELFNSPETLIRLDMSEFMEKHSVSRIIGSPPGYVGYDEAGQLTEKVRRKPYSVLLFDEIEKAHPEVMNILLQILDDGHITDAGGRNVSFENTIIVMTTNAGSSGGNALGFGKDQSTLSSEKTLKALREFLRPEFLGRVDEVVCFAPLTENDFENIAQLMLNELKESLNSKGYSLTWDDTLPVTLAHEAFGGSRGARDLRNVVRRKIEDAIATALIDNANKELSGFHFEQNQLQIIQ
ncbi:MAG: ATP-dependent Clp protease ATP-binding subunit [Clostridia bacterium]|nr:ATP-dependent Clp protease ATP-binding subunit [Clostridia bacterium]